MTGFCEVGACPVQEATPVDYVSPFRQDPVTRCVWLVNYVAVEGTFTCVLKQNNNAMAPTTLTDAAYIVENGWCSAHFVLTIGAITPGASGTEIKVTITGLPAPVSAAAGEHVGTFHYYDAGNNIRFGYVNWDGTDARFGVDANGGVNLGVTPPIAPANGDSISVNLPRYRVA